MASNQVPTVEKWEAAKDAIHQKYAVEGMLLGEVIEAMRREHMFTAT